MTLLQIKVSSFGKWLLAQPHNEAESHLRECLTTGPQNNMGWDLFTLVHGPRWRADAEMFPGMVSDAVSALRGA